MAQGLPPSYPLFKYCEYNYFAILRLILAIDGKIKITPSQDSLHILAYQGDNLVNTN